MLTGKTEEEKGLFQVQCIVIRPTEFDKPMLISTDHIVKDFNCIYIMMNINEANDADDYCTQTR